MKRWPLIALVVVLLLSLVVLLWQRPPAEWARAQQWGQWVQQRGVPGMGLLVLAGMLATAVGLPRQLLGFVAGFAYGVPIGLTVSLLAALGGCALSFLCSRWLLRRFVQRRFAGPLQALDRFVQADAFLKILILRLQPLGTNLMTNLCAGVTTIDARVFLGSSAVGYVPQMLVFALLGSGVRVGSTAQLITSGALFVISLALGGWVWRRHRHAVPV